MEYNHGLAEKQFKEEWKQKEKEYRKVGMSEEMILQIYEYDRAVFNSDRRFLEHYADVQPCGESSEENYDARQTKIQEKNRMVLSSGLYDCASESTIDWTEQIEDKDLFEKIKNLTSGERELLTLYAIEERTIMEISEMKKVSHQTISKKISRIKKKICKVTE